MTLDLKGEWTDADVAKLIGSVKDDRDWRLEVSADGIASLQDKTANPTGVDYDETLHCFLETWSQGTDFVGSSAAGDKELVGKVAKALRENYPTVKKENSSTSRCDTAPTRPSGHSCRRSSGSGSCRRGVRGRSRRLSRFLGSSSGGAFRSSELESSSSTMRGFSIFAVRTLLRFAAKGFRGTSRRIVANPSRGSPSSRGRPAAISALQ
jgi:hypothetical protein